jgi:hypothetical protein
MSVGIHSKSNELTRSKGGGKNPYMGIQSQTVGSESEGAFIQILSSVAPNLFLTVLE